MEIVNREELKDPKFLKLHKYNIVHSNNTFYREFVEIGNAVCALVYNRKNHKYIFVKQFRPGTGIELLELVGGMPNGHTAEECIREEVIEETGYKPEHIELMSVTNWVPAYSTERLHMYYVVVSEKEDNGGGLQHEHEYLEVVEMSKKEILAFDFQKYGDAKTILALSLIGLNKPFQNTYKNINIMDNPDSREYGC